MSRYQVLAVAAVLLVSSACAPLPSGTSSGVPATRDRNYITQDEIRGAASTTALDAVRALRPAWLVKRGPQSVSYEADIVVYLGRARMGGVQALSEIAAGTVTSLEFLDPAAANYRFGAGHPYGAIIVSTREPGAE